MLTFVKNSAKFKHMLYKNRIIKFKNTENSFLFGVRGSGKTALLKRLFPSALYIDLLNETRYQSYLSKIGLFYEEVSNFRNDGLVIVDEIQKMPQLLNEVHRLIESSNRRFILTGSSAKKIRAKGVNLLGGRAGIKALHPFTPEELGEDFNLNQALQYGLLPIVYSAPDQSSKLRNYVETYLKEEIKAEALVRNLPSFARFLKIAGLYHGQVVNRKAFASEAEIPQRSVNDFFSILEDTLLGFFLPAYTPKLKLREQKKPKFYLIDPGIARALKGNFGPLVAEEKGFLFEGLVAQLLRAYKDYKYLCEDISYWSMSEAKTKEVDFLLTRKEGLIAIEVKAKDQVSTQDYRGLRAINQLAKVKRRILVYMGEYNLKTEDGIEVWPFDFFCQNLTEDFQSEFSPQLKKPKPFLKIPLSPEPFTPQKNEKKISESKNLKAEEKLNPLFEKDKTRIINLILKSQIEKAKAKSYEGKIEAFKLHKEKSAEYLKLAYNLFKDKYTNQTNSPYFENEECLVESQRLAHELYSSKMYEEAESLLEEITNNNLNHPEIFKLSYTYFQNGKNRQAIELTEALLKKFPNKIELVHALFSIYESLGNHEKAIQYYEEFLKSNPTNAFARIELAIAYINSEKILKAKALLDTPFDLNKLSMQQINRLALSYRSIGERKKAIDTQYQNIKKNPEELEAQMTYFNLFISLSNSSPLDIKKEEAFLQPDKVGLDCYVKIREIKFLEETDIIIEKEADTYTPNHELSQTLLGKKIGDKIIFQKKEYQITKIESKYVYKYQELIKTAELKYGSKSPLQTLSISKKPDKNEIEEALKKMIPVESSKQQEILDEILQTYREGKITIGILAKIMRQHPIEMMYYFVSSQKNQWISAFPGWEHYKEAKEYLNQRSNLLLGLFSLIMIHKIKMEKYLESSDFKLYICQSTIDSLKEYENKTAMYARYGHLTVSLDENNQLKKDSISPEMVKQELRFVDKVKTWVKEHCKIKPLSEDFVLSRKERLEWEQKIGKEFLDPLLALYNDINTIFLSEDATLRDVFSQWLYQRVPLTGSAKTSKENLQYDLSRQNSFFCSVRLFDLIAYLKNQAIIDNKEEVQFKAGLVEYHQTYIPVDHKILFYLLKKAEYVSKNNHFKRALFFLGPTSDLSGVIHVTADFFIEICQEPALSPYGRQMIINEVLNSVSFGREARSLANQILLNVQLKTQFLPILQQEIQSYIMLWLKGKGG